jgi:hypothetical protein
MDEEDHEQLTKKRPTSPPVVLTKSNSFITRIKHTFAAKNKQQQALNDLHEDTLIDQADILIKNSNKKEEDLLIPIPATLDNASSTTSSSFDEDDYEEEEALDKRLVRQVTEMFGRSMFIFSNTCGN